MTKITDVCNWKTVAICSVNTGQAAIANISETLSYRSTRHWKSLSQVKAKHNHVQSAVHIFPHVADGYTAQINVHQQQKRKSNENTCKKDE